MPDRALRRLDHGRHVPACRRPRSGHLRRPNALVARGSRAIRPDSLRLPGPARRGANARQVTQTLEVGVQLPEVEREVRWPEMLALARRAESSGFDSVWVGDHMLYRG